jgi:hypothetical protein
MLLVQEYLRTHSFDDLAKEHGVYASFSKSGHKWSLNYDQLESKENDPLAQQCRGLILAASDGHSFLPQANTVDGKLRFDHITPGDTVVLAYPMNRFFNYGQGAAEVIDWNDPNVRILEKLDGTLTIVYFDIFTGKWCVATRSVPEADVVLDSGYYTFRTLFEAALQSTFKYTKSASLFEEFCKLHLDKEVTYCFELTSPHNRIVVAYPESRITLLAARRIVQGTQAIVGGSCWDSFEEIDVKNILSNVPHARTYTFASVNDVLDWVSTLNPTENEGVVVMIPSGSNFKRIKIKNPAYLAFNRARDILSTSERNCVELVLAGKDDDVIGMLPNEIVERITKIKLGINLMIKDYDRAFKMFKYASDKLNPGDKKTFAIMVNEYKEIWSSPMFSMFDGKSSNMKDFIDKNKKEGTWGDSFLDRILEISKRY